MPNTDGRWIVDAIWVVDADANIGCLMEAAVEEGKTNISIWFFDLACVMNTWCHHWVSIVHLVHQPKQIRIVSRGACCVHNSKLPKSTYLKYIDFQTYISKTQLGGVEEQGECC
jgi:hypothetical protein